MNNLADIAAGEVRSEAGEGEDPIPIPGSVLAVEVNNLADIAAGEVRSKAGEGEDLQVEDDRPLLVRYKAGPSPSEFPVPAAWSRMLVAYYCCNTATQDYSRNPVFFIRHCATVSCLLSYFNQATVSINLLCPRIFFIFFLISLSPIRLFSVSVNLNFCTGKIHHRFRKACISCKHLIKSRTIRKFHH